MEAQVSVSQSHFAADWVDTDDLPKSDWVHFNNIGILTLGERMAKAWRAAIQDPPLLRFNSEPVTTDH
jgi:hypothetical protein